MGDFIGSGWSIFDFLLLVAAVVLFLKLRSTLGHGNRLDADEKEKTPAFQAESVSGNRPATPALIAPPTDEELWAKFLKDDLIGPSILEDKKSFLSIIRELHTIDPTFDLRIFVDRIADLYELVTAAYAKGDLHTLKTYLSEPVYQAFEKVIHEQQKKGRLLTRALVAFKKIQLQGIFLSLDEIKVAVLFVCDVVSAVRDKEGHVLEGDPITSRPVKDEWIFSCSRLNKEAVWIVSETA